MIRIAITDDEPVFADHVSALAKAFFQRQAVDFQIQIYHHANELLWDVEDGQYYDIYLIDIEMPGTDGMALAYAIRQHSMEPFIIFVTSHEEYSIQCYEYNAHRYIVKNTMDTELPKAFRSMLEKIQTREERYYVMEMHQSLKRIAYNDIYYIYKNGKYAVFVTAQGEQSDRKSLSKVMEELDDVRFMFAERGHIVNIHHIMQVGDYMVTMRNQKKIPVSIPQFQKLKLAISDYWRRRS